MRGGIVAAGAGAPAALLLPGALGRAETLAPAIAWLARRRRVLAVDHHALALHPEWFANSIAESLDAEKCDRAHFIGFSLGAELARQTALLLPDRCASLVAVGAGSADPERGRRLRRALPLLRWLPAFVLRRKVRAELASLLRGDDAASDAVRWRLFDLLRSMPRRELLRARERLAVLDGSAIASLPLPAKIPALRLELGADEVIPASERALLAARIPHAIVETLPGLGHGATLLLPQLLLERIDPWLERCSSSSSPS